LDGREFGVLFVGMKVIGEGGHIKKSQEKRARGEDDRSKKKEGKKMGANE